MDNYLKADQLSTIKDPDLIYKIGQSADKVHSYPRALEYYNAYLATDEMAHQADALYKVARLEHQVGNYDKAMVNYDLYLSEYSGSDAKRDKEATFYKSAAEWALSADPENRITATYRLGDTINTNASENGPALLDDELYYSSLRFPIEDDPLQRSKSELLNGQDVIKIPGISEESLISNPSFNDAGTSMYFSVCRYGEFYDINCQLYTASVSETSALGTARKLPDHVNIPGTNTTHPSIASIDGTQYLYFASDRIGGSGGYDIYRSVLTDDFVFGSPENISKVNSSGNDITPYFSATEKMLYFSSDGRKGYGGYDIYGYSEKEDEPVNIGKNINTAYNELYYSCLLYTSPSPRDATLSRMPSSA